jgi:hypothetical protein
MTMAETDGSFGADGGGAGTAPAVNGAGNGAAPPAASPEPRADQRFADYQNRRNEAERTAQAEPQLRQGQQRTAEPPKAGDPKASGDSAIDLGDGVKMTGAEIRALLANKAAADSKALSRPQSPDAYRAELPSDWKPPEGLPPFTFDQNDPLLAQARAVAHTEGLSQEGFSRLLGLYAGSQMISQQQVTAGRNAEVAKLGPTGPARVAALDTFFRATLGAADGAERIARIFTARDVEIAEREMAKMQGNSSSSFSGRGREAPPPGAPFKSPEEVAAMSPRERLDYSRQFDQRAMPAWRDPRGG